MPDIAIVDDHGVVLVLPAPVADVTVVEQNSPVTVISELAAEITVIPGQSIFNITSLGNAPQNFRQETPLTVWSIPHTLNRSPVVQVTDLAGNLLLAQIRAGPTTIVVTHASPQIGIVIYS